jgi:tetratricopeptide (TPR) repeat protein
MISRSLFSSLIAIVALLVALGATAAADQPSSPEADDEPYRQAFVDGRTLFEDEQWAEARAAFEKAYALQPTPLLLFNIGSTYRREGDRERAIEYYRRYLVEAPDDAELRALAEETIAELEDELAALREPEPPPRPVITAAEVTRTDAAPARPGRALRITGVVLVAAGGVALGWAGVDGYRARTAASDIEGLEPGTPWTAEQQARWDEGEDAERRALILGIGGGATVVVGGLVYWLGHRRGQAGAGRVAVTPVLAPDHTGLAITGAF